MNLKFKILMPILILTLIGMISLSLLAYLTANGIITDNVEALLQSRAEKLTVQIDGQIELWLSEMKMLSTRESFKKMDWKAIKVYMEKHEDIFKKYEIIFTADTEGNYVTSLGVEGNIGHRDYFPLVMQGQTVFSDPVVSNSTGNLISVIAVPLKDDSGSVTGLLAATIELTALSDYLNAEKIGKTGFAYMLNQQGIFVAHPDPSFILNKNMTDEESFPKSVTDTAQKMLKEAEGHQYYVENHSKKLVSYRNLQSTGWPVAVVVPFKEVSTQMGVLRNTSLLVNLIVIPIMILITYWVVSRSTAPLKKMSQITHDVSQGNLNHQLALRKGNDEIANLSRDFNQMIQNTGTLIIDAKNIGSEVSASADEIAASATQMNEASQNITATVHDLAQAASEQAGSLQDGQEKIQAITQAVKSIHENTKDSETLIGKAQHILTDGNKIVSAQLQMTEDNKKSAEKVSAAIISLSTKSGQIDEIINTIQDIAEQTNLLALNAAIEAARAGEQGKGFAVVAGEVKKLAEESSVSSLKIANLIKEIRSATEEAVKEIEINDKVVIKQEESMKKTYVSFEEIQHIFDTIFAQSGVIVSLTDKLAGNVTQVDEVISGIAAISEENAASSEEIAATVEKQSELFTDIDEKSRMLSQKANQLLASLAKFQVDKSEL